MCCAAHHYNVNIKGQSLTKDVVTRMIKRRYMICDDILYLLKLVALISITSPQLKDRKHTDRVG